MITSEGSETILIIANRLGIAITKMLLLSNIMSDFQLIV